jgi:hypothetical protein
MGLSPKAQTALMTGCPAVLLPFLIVSMILYYRRTKVPFFTWEAAPVLMRIMAWANLFSCIDALLLGVCTYYCSKAANDVIWVSFRIFFNIMRLCAVEHITKTWLTGRIVSYLLTVVILTGFGLQRFYVQNQILSIPLIWGPYLFLGLVFFNHAGRAEANKGMSVFERRASRDMMPLLVRMMILIMIMTIIIIIIIMVMMVVVVYGSVDSTLPEHDESLLKCVLVSWLHPQAANILVITANVALLLVNAEVKSRDSHQVLSLTLVGVISALQVRQLVDAGDGTYS